MSIEGTLRGAAARIRWEIATAAVVEGFTITRFDDDWWVHAALVMRDAFNMSRSPLYFETKTPLGRWWSWQVVRIDCNEPRRFIAKVARPIVRGVPTADALTPGGLHAVMLRAPDLASPRSLAGPLDSRPRPADRWRPARDVQTLLRERSRWDPAR